jgi:hypothetical protein
MEAEEGEEGKQTLTANYIAAKVKELEKEMMPGGSGGYGKRPPGSLADDPEGQAREILGVISHLNKVAIDDPETLFKAAKSLFETAFAALKGASQETLIRSGYSKFLSRILEMNKNPTEAFDKAENWSDDEKMALEEFLTGHASSYYSAGAGEHILNELMDIIKVPESVRPSKQTVAQIRGEPAPEEPDDEDAVEPEPEPGAKEPSELDWLDKSGEVPEEPGETDWLDEPEEGAAQPEEGAAQPEEGAAQPEADPNAPWENAPEAADPAFERRNQQLREMGSKTIQVKRTMGDKVLAQVLGKDAAGNRKTKWITVNANEIGGIEPEGLEGRIWQHLKDKADAYNAEKAELAQQAETNPEAAARLKHVTSKFNQQWSGDLRSGMKNLETQVRATKPEDFLGYLKQQLGETPKEMMFNAYQQGVGKRDKSGQVLEIIGKLKDQDIGRLKGWYKPSKASREDVTRILQKYQREFSPLNDDCNIDPYAQLLSEGPMDWLKKQWGKGESGALSSLGRQVSKMGKGLGRMLTSKDVQLAQQFVQAKSIVRSLVSDPNLPQTLKKLKIDIDVKPEMAGTSPEEAVPGEEPDPMAWRDRSSSEESSQDDEEGMSYDDFDA